MKNIEDLKNEINRLQQQRKPHEEALTLIALKEKEIYQQINQHFKSVFSTELKKCNNDFERLAMYINYNPVPEFEEETSFDNIFHYSETAQFKNLFETHSRLDLYDINMYISSSGIMLYVKIYDDNREKILSDERFKSFLNGITPYLKYNYYIIMDYMQPITYNHNSGKWIDDTKELIL